jgi:beta-N-acetylhexosaminidase
MSEALLKGRWTARETSELRRQELLPRDKALKWDQLMVEPRYMHALSLLP